MTIKLSRRSVLFGLISLPIVGFATRNAAAIDKKDNLISIPCTAGGPDPVKTIMERHEKTMPEICRRTGQRHPESITVKFEHSTRLITTHIWMARMPGKGRSGFSTGQFGTKEQSYEVFELLKSKYAGPGRTTKLSQIVVGEWIGAAFHQNII